MIFLFLSVVAICATALVAFRMHVGALPKCSKAEFDSMRVAHNNLTRVVTTLANKAGLAAKLHTPE